jgi:dolichol-phosphate mannosyltransferase
VVSFVRSLLKLSVVIPTYNEAENLPELVSALFRSPLEDLKILVVDDNSPDGTGVIADELTASYPARFEVLHRSGKMGLGTAYIQGFQKVLQEGAEAVAQMDADFSHPPELLVGLMTTLQDCDVALGSRYVAGGAVDHDWPAWRKGLSAFGNFYARLILRLPVRDTTGGYRMWRRETLLGMPLHRVKSNGYAFQVEMIYLAHRLGYRFKEIPFYFADRKWGHSKMSLRIQREAAIRVWQLLSEYQSLTQKT